MRWLGLLLFGFLLVVKPVRAVGELPSYTASPSAQVAPSLALTPTTRSLPKLPFMPERVSCQELVVTGDGQAVPARVAFTILGTIKDGVKYKIEFGDGEVYEGSSSAVTHTYLTPGTLTVKGYVKDEAGFSYGGNEQCQKIVKVLAAQPLTTQPQTGPSWISWGFILTTGILGGWLYRRALGG